MSTKEYQFYHYLKHWKKEDNLNLLRKLTSEIGPFFSYWLRKTEELYRLLPLRKDGLNPLTHPLNVILALKQAKVNDEVILTIALLHDYIEEQVDLFRDKNNLAENNSGIRLLDDYEQKCLRQLETELKGMTDEKKTRTIIDTLKLLTRHKRDFYYRSISNIFDYHDEKIKETAIQIKLADRMHNIL